MKNPSDDSAAYGPEDFKQLFTRLRDEEQAEVIYAIILRWLQHEHSSRRYRRLVGRFYKQPVSVQNLLNRHTKLK